MAVDGDGPALITSVRWNQFCYVGILWNDRSQSVAAAQPGAGNALPGFVHWELPVVDFDGNAAELWFIPHYDGVEYVDWRVGGGGRPAKMMAAGSLVLNPTPNGDVWYWGADFITDRQGRVSDSLYFFTDLSSPPPGVPGAGRLWMRKPWPYPLVGGESQSAQSSPLGSFATPSQQRNV